MELCNQVAGLSAPLHALLAPAAAAGPAEAPPDGRAAACAQAAAAMAALRACSLLALHLDLSRPAAQSVCLAARELAGAAGAALGCLPQAAASRAMARQHLLAM